MSARDDGEITALLARLRAGDADAMRALFPAAYDTLRQMAHRELLGGARDRTLSTTALVNETYLQLATREHTAWNDRRHFYAYAAQAMRHILVDHARRRGASKRGGDAVLIDWHSASIPVEAIGAEMLALDDALDRLASLDEGLARVVELRFFAGLSIEQVADTLGVAHRTVDREWEKARAVLKQLLE